MPTNSMNVESTFSGPRGEPLGLKWYCLRAKARRESMACRQLHERTGLDVFAPRLQRPPRSRGRERVSEALFPGYLFCRMSVDRDLRAVNATPEILGVVNFGGYAPPVADPIIDFLREHTTTPFAPEPVLAAGDWVKVLQGPLAGQAGRVAAINSAEDRAQLLVALLGNEIRVEVPVRAIEPATPALRFPAPLLAAAGT